MSDKGQVETAEIDVDSFKSMESGIPSTAIPVDLDSREMKRPIPGVDKKPTDFGQEQPPQEAMAPDSFEEYEPPQENVAEEPDRIWIPPEKLLEGGRVQRKFTGKLQRLRQSLGIEVHRYKGISIKTKEGDSFYFKVRNLDYADTAWAIGCILPGQNIQEMTMHSQATSLAIAIVGIGSSEDDVVPVYQEMGVEVPDETLAEVGDVYNIPPPWRHITADIMLQFLREELHPDVVDHLYEEYRKLWNADKNPLILENTKDATRPLSGSSQNKTSNSTSEDESQQG